MNDFISVIENLILLFRDMILIEQEKLEATQKNRVTFVEECMKKEQASILKLRGLDKKREICQTALGYEGFTFKQILEAVSAEERSALRELFDSLTYHVRLFQDINQSAQSMLEVNLHMINKEINGSQQYTKAGKAQWEELL